MVLMMKKINKKLGVLNSCKKVGELHYKKLINIKFNSFPREFKTECQS